MSLNLYFLGLVGNDDNKDYYKKSICNIQL